MRRDGARLKDMLEALDSLEGIIAGTNETDFLSSDVQYYAVAQLLTVVGEAASRVSSELKAKFPAVEWRTIVGFRNVLVHQYFSVLRPMVWQVAACEARTLRGQINHILSAEFAEFNDVESPK
jgi:uncharacterized protein with HEPN domain